MLGVGVFYRWDEGRPEMVLQEIPGDKELCIYLDWLSLDPLEKAVHIHRYSS